MKNLFLFAAILAAFSLQAQEINFNLVKNGTFDGKPSTTNWTIEVADAVIVNQSKDGNSGGYAWLNHNALATDPAVSQKIDGFQVGNVYVVSGTYKVGKHANIHGAKPGQAFFAVDMDGKELKNYILPAMKTDAIRCDDVTWMPFSVTFTATNASHTLRLRGEINSSDGDVAVDNIVVQSEMAGWFRLVNKFRGNGECLEGNKVDGTVKAGGAFMDKRQNVTGQIWRLEPAGDGFYRLKNKFRGNADCLEGNKVDGTEKAGSAFMDKTQNVTGQLWKFVADGDHYRLKTKFRGDGDCLEGNQINGTAKGGAAFMDKCQNVTGQLWKLEKVDSKLVGKMNNSSKD
jgi:hypothetical protein